MKSSWKIGGTMKSLAQKNALVIYYLLAVIISTVVSLPLILSTQGIISQDVSPEWHPLGALGPILAASLTAYFIRGKLGLVDYLKSLRDTKFSLKLFLFSISPLLIYPIIAVPVSLFSKPASQDITRLSPIWWIGMVVASLAYGIGEEAGWRGFALPRLQTRMNAWWSIFVLTIFHALWHIPFFFYRLHFDGIGATIGFFVGMLAGGIFMTYLYNESGGKTLLPIIFHTAINVNSQLSFATQPEIAYATSTILMIAAVIVVIVFRPTNLATRPRFSVDDSVQ